METEEDARGEGGRVGGKGVLVLKRWLFKEPPHINSCAPLSDSNKLLGGT